MTSITHENLLSTTKGGVRTITLNRPRTLNSLSLELMRDLKAALEDAASDEQVRCIVLTGAGKSFSSGAALEFDPSEFDVQGALRDYYNPVVRILDGMDKPTVAAVRGMAAGAGAALSLACDFRVASEDARFAFLFVRIGAALDAGASYYLPRLIGRARAAELAMLGEAIAAEDAFEIGLVNRVVPTDQLEKVTEELARRLSDGPLALRLIKRELRESATNDLEAQLELELELQVAAGESTDFHEGVRAFIEKRPAAFKCE